MQHRNFYLEWLSRAFREAFLSVGFQGRGEVMRAAVLWAIAVLFLYSIDWSGLPMIGTLNAEPAHEVRFGLCAVVASVIVFSGFFVWHLIVQPVRIHRESWEEINANGELIASIGDVEADRRFLSEMHKEGFRLYRAPVDPNPQSIAQWKTAMNTWVELVKTHLRERWSVSALHDFEDSGAMGGFTYRRMDNTTDDPLERTQDGGFSILCRYSAYLKSVDDIIRFGEYKHLGDVQELLAKRETFKKQIKYPPTHASRRP